jgi:hypothetical protein
VGLFDVLYLLELVGDDGDLPDDDDDDDDDDDGELGAFVGHLVGIRVGFRVGLLDFALADPELELVGLLFVGELFVGELFVGDDAFVGLFGVGAAAGLAVFFRYDGDFVGASTRTLVSAFSMSA